MLLDLRFDPRSFVAQCEWLEVDLDFSRWHGSGSGEKLEAVSKRLPQKRRRLSRFF